MLPNTGPAEYNEDDFMAGCITLKGSEGCLREVSNKGVLGVLGSSVPLQKLKVIWSADLQVVLSTMVVVDGEEDDDDEMRTIKGFQGSSQISPLSSVYYRRGGPLPSARRRRRRRTHPSAPVLSERASKMMTMLTKMILMLIIILVTYHQLPVAPV